ncbi:MAG: fimbrillin family protein [Muribaculum sp.]|nr:fimbrillin family protein [Muribaculum sp.]
MKKERLLYAGSMAVALALASCSSDEPISRNTSDGLISYGVITSNQTRALHSFCANEMPESFTIWADYSEGEGTAATKNLYIDGDEVKQINGNRYQSDNLRYWPEGDKALNFYAFVDADYTKNTGESATYFDYNDGAPKFENFTVNGDVTKQKDLMYATVIGQKKSTSSTVELNFRHALSQICFKALNENSNLEITVNSISIANIAGTGTYNLPTDNSTDNNYENHTDEYDNPTETYHRGYWEAIAETVQDETFEVPFEDGIVIGTKTATNLSRYSTDADKLGAESNYSNVLNLIPQSRNAANSVSADDGAYFILNLSIQNVLNDPSLGENTQIVTEEEFYVPASIAWAQGHRYIYTFNFAKDWTPDNDNFTLITYTVNVDDFITGEEQELPYRQVKMRNAYTDEEGVYHPALYFADRNIGASSSEDPGLYFFLGDTEGIYAHLEYDEDGDAFTECYDNSGRIIKLSDYMAKKELAWGKDSSLRNWYTTEKEINNKPILPYQYDAARLIMGDNWRIPTIEDFEYLLTLEWVKIGTDNTEKQESYKGAIKGYKVISKECGTEIFFPLTGFIDYTDLNHIENQAYYIISSITDDDGDWWLDSFGFRCDENYDSKPHTDVIDDFDSYLIPIRAVIEK